MTVGTLYIVSAASGTGKTSLIKQIQTMVRDKYGYLIQGKFDQYEKGDIIQAYEIESIAQKL